MRTLGLLFVLALVLGIFGYARGWFSITTTHAAGKNDVTLAVDQDKIADDARTAAAKISALSAQAADKVKALGRKVGTDTSELEGKVTAIDAAARRLTVTASSQAIELQVGTDVVIARDGVAVDLAQLRTDMPVHLQFQKVGDSQRLTRIQILP